MSRLIRGLSDGWPLAALVLLAFCLMISPEAKAEVAEKVYMPNMDGNS